ncbi:hypothetical protein [Nocardia carnea]|uniref:Uncharacterized protein n=1 Tax=Nocardia carnea TaxID=37328 RepID=A0ABW7TKT6_9NOCA|nr:hypothetical protein [Nocardia carnea]
MAAPISRSLRSLRDRTSLTLGPFTTTLVAAPISRSLRSLRDRTSLTLGPFTTTLVAAPTTRSLRSLILVDLPSAPVAAGC